MSEAYDKMRKQNDMLRALVEQQHTMVEEIAVAFENGTTSLDPFFLAKHVAVLRRRAYLLAMDVRAACDNTGKCPDCGMECSYARYIEEYDTFLTERKQIIEQREHR